jgi:repressor LexA
MNLIATFAERFKKALEIKNKTQSDVSKATKISKSSISEYLRGEHTPNQLKTYIIASYLNVSIEWLLGFDADIEPKQEYPLKFINEDELIKIPVYGRIPAGVPLEAVEDIIDYVEVSKDLTKGGRELAALQIKGDSMLPNYMNGDIVIFEKCPDCENGQDCAVYINGYDATLKRVVKQEDGIWLQAINPAYETKFYPYKGGESIQILGVAIEIKRKLR